MSQKQNSKRRKILIIEDDAVVAMLYRKHLERGGFEVVIAEDGEKGLDRLCNWRPDGLLLDLLLPKVNGLEILAKIQSSDQFRDLKTVVVTNTYGSLSAIESMELGAKWVLDKSTTIPLQLVDLFQSVWKSSQASGLLPLEGAAIQANSASAAQTETNCQDRLMGSAERYWDNPNHYYLYSAQPMQEIKEAMKRIRKAKDPFHIHSDLSLLERCFHSLSGKASVYGLYRLGRIGLAAHALLQDILSNPEKWTFSVQNTLTTAIQCFDDLLRHGFDAAERRLQFDTNILVVDDQEPSRKAILIALKQVGLKAVTTPNPLTALEILQINDFDLIFLDYEMPEMSGAELCKRLREMPRHKRSPVVFITGKNTPDSKDEIQQSGGDEFIAKPFLFKEMALKAILILLMDNGRLPGGKDPENRLFDISTAAE